MSGLGERGSRLREVARRLEPAPAIPPFYVQQPDDELRAVGWYLRWERGSEPVYLGHSAIAAEMWIRLELHNQKSTGKRKGKAGAQARKARAKRA